MVVITLWTTWFNGFKSIMVLYFIFRLYKCLLLLLLLLLLFYGYGWEWMDDLFMDVVGNEQVNVMTSKCKEH